MPLETRACVKCEVVYPRTEHHFVVNWTCSDGMEGQCKKCRNARVLAYKQANSSALAARRRAAYASDSGTACKTRERTRQARDPFRWRARTICAGMRARAAKLNLPFDALALTVEAVTDRLKRRPNCECCDVPFDITFRTPGRLGPCVRSPTADRIDPWKGYVTDNVAILCWRCNNLKRDATSRELETVASWMRNREYVAVEIMDRAA